MKHLGTKVIETDRLILRPLQMGDAKELCLGIRNQPEFMYYTNKRPISLEEQEKAFLTIENKYKHLDYYNWVFVLKDTWALIGMLHLSVTDKHDMVEFNYGIDNRYMKQGYMTEALKAITAFALDELQVNRIQGGCVVENVASRKVMEKCGYEYEATLKKYIKLSDGYHDMHLFAITK